PEGAVTALAWGATNAVRARQDAAVSTTVAASRRGRRTSGSVADGMDAPSVMRALRFSPCFQSWLLSACLVTYAGYSLSARAQISRTRYCSERGRKPAVINEAAPKAADADAHADADIVAGADANSAAADGTAASLERLFGRYHFPPGPRRILLAAATAFAERGFHATTTR